MINSNYEEFEEILKEERVAFLDNIAHEMEKPHDGYFNNFGFPMFGTISKYHHEQVYFESYLEYYTRVMINDTIKTMLDEIDCAGDRYSWPEFEELEIYKGYTNSECEDEFGLEIVDKIDKVGYRYTLLNIDRIDEFKEKWNVNKVVVVKWEEDDYFTPQESAIDIISPRELFRRLFFDIREEEVQEYFDEFIKCVRESVKRARERISLNTLPGFSPAYIHKTRKNVAGSLRREVGQLSAFFVENKKYKEIEEKSRLLVEKYKIPQIFLDRHLEEAFMGTSCYAKSFMTSEYLYRNFKNNPLFDYTPIVSGYIKSIEQILNDICVNFYKSQKSTEIELRNGKREDHTKGCSLQRNLQKISTFSLGEYTYFFKNNEHILRDELRESAKEIIANCLSSYRIECRNHLFHKVAFNDWERVETIRRNTIFLYAILLGAIDPGLLGKNEMGILDMEYDRLFEILDKKESGSYSFKLNDVMYCDMTKEPRFEGIQYTARGQIKNHIVFRKCDYDGDKLVEISYKNMPSEMWETVGNGESQKMVKLL